MSLTLEPESHTHASPHIVFFWGCIMKRTDRLDDKEDRPSKRLARVVPEDTPPAVLSALEQLPPEILTDIVANLESGFYTYASELERMQKTSTRFMGVVREMLVRQLRKDWRIVMAGVRAWDVQVPLDRDTVAAAQRIGTLLRGHVVSDAWYVAHGCMDEVRGAPMVASTRSWLLLEDLTLLGDVPIGEDALRLVHTSYPVVACSHWIRALQSELMSSMDEAPYMDWVHCWYALNTPTDRYHLLQDFMWVRRFVVAWAEADAACCFAHLLVRVFARHDGDRAMLFTATTTWENRGGTVFLYMGQPWLTLAMAVPLATRVLRIADLGTVLASIRLFNLADQPVHPSDVGHPPPHNDTFHRRVAEPLSRFWLHEQRPEPYYGMKKDSIVHWVVPKMRKTPTTTLSELATRLERAIQRPRGRHQVTPNYLLDLRNAPVESAMWRQIQDSTGFKPWPTPGETKGPDSSQSQSL